MIATLLLLVLTLTAAVTDFRWHKIYNWTTYPGILAAFLVSSWEPGGIGLEESLKGFFGCGLIMVACLIFFRIGGGDVKLIAMLGAFLGFRLGLEAMLWTFVLGAVLGISLLIWRIGAVRLLSRGLKRIWWWLRAGVWTPLPAEDRLQLQSRLFLAPAAFVAVLIVKFSTWHS